MLFPSPHPLASDAPLFALVVRTPRLVMRPVWDEDIAGLTDASLAGIHPDDEMPFAAPWSRAERPALFAGTAASIWNERASRRSPDDWSLSFAVREADGDSEWWNAPIVGRQDIWAKEFPLLRSVESGSWLTQSAQGRGLGLEMRLAVLMFAFDCLGATEATSGAYAWNKKSLGVSAKAGYAENGSRRVAIEGRQDTEVLVAMPKENLKRPDWTLEVHGGAEARTALGIPDEA